MYLACGVRSPGTLGAGTDVNGNPTRNEDPPEVVNSCGGMNNHHHTDRFSCTERK